MADYKNMYLDLLSATEKTIRLLAEAQRSAEERYLAGEEPTLILPQDAAETE